MNDIELLVHQLIRLDGEHPWLEFKVDNYDHTMIGRDISALANSAVYHERDKAYLIWGVSDDTHEVVGTKFTPKKEKHGNQELEGWLRILLSKNAEFGFEKGICDGKEVVVLTVYPAVGFTVMFEKTDYIRVGTSTRPLNDYPAMKAQVWNRLSKQSFEVQTARDNLLLHEALELLDYHVYFQRQNKPVPGTEDGIAYYLTEDNILVKQDDGRYAITNMGAVLFAYKLVAFPTVRRKAMRVVQYADDSKLSVVREETFQDGYARGFDRFISFIQALIPAKEEYEGAARKTVYAYPELAIRELVANALIHQDFSITGTGPLIEIFASRLEISNPGTLLVEMDRIIDNPARSRNEILAALMRQLHFCEESGTGWDKIALSCELAFIPSPRIDSYPENTKVTMFSETKFSSIPIESRIWSCYLHACLNYLEGKQITNTSLRTRFGQGEVSSSSASKIIKECLERKLIRPFDPLTAPRYMKYVPYWA